MGKQKAVFSPHESVFCKPNEKAPILNILITNCEFIPANPGLQGLFLGLPVEKPVEYGENFLEKLDKTGHNMSVM